MDIKATGVIVCDHAPGECGKCELRMERRCRADAREHVVDECTCPRPPGLKYTESFGRQYYDPGTMSHDCPIHGAPIEPKEP